MGLPDSFAVPACAFGIKLLVHFLVGLGGPFEGVGKGSLVDFVVVVDEFAGFVDGVGVVGLGGELMGMPGEVDVEGRNGDFVRMLGDDVHVAGIFCDEPLHRGHSGRRMNPIDGVHLLDEGTLADNGTDKVQSEGRGVAPVMRHHAADGDAFFLVQMLGTAAVGSPNTISIYQRALDRCPDARHVKCVVGWVGRILDPALKITVFEK